ncbi:MAG: hypothetical protein V4632_17595 [Pseudomonadota bacterium]
MKKLVIVLAAAGGLLSGCIGYGVPYNNEPVYRSDRGDRDRDRDGVPNRADRDRDGDGVRNRADSNPNNPRRY